MTSRRNKITKKTYWLRNNLTGEDEAKTYIT